ncbi:MAG: hypothetical protein TREMPRED_002594, partial [Tremellales sp. Tagirdzhanova-0007]
MAYKKTNKAFEKVQQDKVLTDIDLERRRAAEEMNRVMMGIKSGWNFLRDNCLTNIIIKIMLTSYNSAGRR